MQETLTPDLCIIGAGAGGLEAAAAARRLGASVVLVEKHRSGGSGLFSGSVASKALKASAHLAQAIRSSSAYGVAVEGVRANFGRIRDHISSAIDNVASDSSVQRFEALGVQVVAAEASFIDRRTVQAGEFAIRARRFVIATGSHPHIPAIAGLETVPYFTTDTIFGNSRRPAHLLVIGGGAIGLEIAQSYRRLGVEVTVVDKATMLRHSDPELAAVALRRLEEEGVTLRPGQDVTEVASGDSGLFVTLRPTDEKSADTDTVVVSHLLLATGRVPNLEGLAIEKARIATEKADPLRLALKANLRTTNSRVFAIGDAAGALHYAHVATHQARRVVDAALLGRGGGARDAIIPYAVFTDPELAEVGMTEPEARRRFKDRFRVVRASFAQNDRARAERRTYGVAKLICDPAGRIVGAGLVGDGAAELVGMFALAIGSGLGMEHLGRFIAPYPSLSGIVEQLVAEYGREIEPPRSVQRRLALARFLP